MNYRHPPLARSSCKGMTMIEVLVAAVIIGVGLLGVASLQVTALQGASNAEYRSRATDLIASLADRMRANLDGVDINSYSDATANTAADCANPPATICAMTPNATNTSGVTQCDPAEMAAFDLWEVRCSNGVQNSLPRGLMSIACTEGAAPPGDTCAPLSPMVITITWQVQDSAATPVTETVVATIIPGAP
ncbi:MAG: type IV pilus modification protein PilV [Candidatus Thiodiazotropha sp. L084R]